MVNKKTTGYYALMLFLLVQSLVNAQEAEQQQDTIDSTVQTAQTENIPRSTIQTGESDKMVDNEQQILVILEQIQKQLKKLSEHSVPTPPVQQDTILSKRFGTFAKRIEQLLSQTLDSNQTQQQAFQNRQIQTIEELQWRLDELIKTVKEQQQKNQQNFQHTRQTLDQILGLLDENKKLLAENQQLRQQIEQLHNENQNIQQHIQKDYAIIHFNFQINFPSKGFYVNKQQSKILDKIATLAKQYPDYLIQVIGHTDNIPIAKENKKWINSNWELSAARAGSVVLYLQHGAGIDPKRIQLIGLGPYHPVNTENTAQARRMNRRIEVQLVPDYTKFKIKTIDVL